MKNIVLTVVLASGGLPLLAQEAAKERSSPAADARPVRLDLEVSRFEGDRRVSILPYTLFLAGMVPGSGRSGTSGALRMGVEVPVRMGGDKEGAKDTFQYKNVGTSIDARASLTPDGRYEVQLDLEMSGVRGATEEKSGVMWSLPLFESFRARAQVFLRGGESSEFVAGTDPVNGEVVRVKATLTVLK